MISPLYHYWLYPSSWRRWHGIARIAAAMCFCIVSVWLASIPIFIWLPGQVWKGLGGIVAELLYMLCLIILSLLLTIAGATTIAPERDRLTWESLYMTPVGSSRLVWAKLICRIIRCAGFMWLVLPFFISWAFEALWINRAGPADDSPWRNVRLTVYLSWFAIRTIGHVLPCVAIGVAISAFCKRSRTAICAAVVAVIGYGVVLWGLSIVPSVFVSETSSKLLLWPVLAVDWHLYDPGSLVSSNWISDAIADTVWLVAIPMQCYVLAIWRCSRRPG